jgi:hypothetical protein
MSSFITHGNGVLKVVKSVAGVTLEKDFQRPRPSRAAPRGRAAEPNSAISLRYTVGRFGGLAIAAGYAATHHPPSFACSTTVPDLVARLAHTVGDRANLELKTRGVKAMEGASDRENHGALPEKGEEKKLPSFRRSPRSPARAA